MRVQDLVKNSIWRAPTNYLSGRNPAISVILPTFRRNESGLFQKVVDSILGQTFTDYELIFVDDGSTDGTADRIRAFCDEFPNFGAITHPNNIGLPAISSFEAFQKSRGQFIFFSFDDFILESEAFEKLYKRATANQQEASIVHGKANWGKYVDGNIEIVGTIGSQKSFDQLPFGSSLSNGSALVHREVFERVGYFDPHILNSRLNDWDFWRRASQVFDFEFVDYVVGTEFGAHDTASLGNNHELTSWITLEWIESRRDDLLRPANYPLFDVVSVPETSSKEMKEYSPSLFRRKFGHLIDTSNSSVKTAVDIENSDISIAVVMGAIDTSSQLTFDYMPENVRQKFRFIVAPDPRNLDVSVFAKSDAIIWIRNFDFFEESIELAASTGIPQYLYVDDNFPVLATEQPALFDEIWRDEARLRSALAALSGVLTSNAQLTKYFKDHELHSFVHELPIWIGDRELVQNRGIKRVKHNDEVVIAFAGGTHRLESLKTVVAPELAKLSIDLNVKVRLVIHSIHEIIRDQWPIGDCFSIEVLPFSRDYRIMIRRLRDTNPDFLIHPQGEYTENNQYKGLHTIATAFLLDSFYVLADNFDVSQNIVGFDQIPRPQNASDPSAWASVLRPLLSSEQMRQALVKANASMAEIAFGGLINRATYSEMIRNNIVHTNRAELNARWENLLSESMKRESLKIENARKAVISLESQLRQSAETGETHSRPMRILNKIKKRLLLWRSVQSASAENAPGLNEDLDAAILRIRSGEEFPSNLVTGFGYVEYLIELRAGEYSGFEAFITGTELPARLKIGIEIVTDSDGIVFHNVRKFQVDTQRVTKISFNMPALRITGQNETVAVRIWSPDFVPFAICEFRESASNSRQILGGFI